MFTWNDKYKRDRHHSSIFKPLEPIITEKIDPICAKIADKNPQLALDMFKERRKK